MEEENGWFPSLEEYNPNITKEQWIEFVRNENVFTENALITFACIQKAGIASCADMAEQFGRNFNFYNSNNWRTGERVHKITNCPLSERTEGENRFWSVCCLGKYHKNGHFEFKIRPELQEAFEETKRLEGIEVMEKNVRFWSGGIKWGEEDKFKEFSDNGYWQIGWGVDDNSKGAKQAWKNIKEVQIGDFFAFHGYGGQNDLRIYQVSNVTGKDEAEGTLYLKRLNSETDKLFHGKAPKLDKGGWFGTLFEITGKSAINAIFRKFLNEIQGASTMTNENLTAYTNLLKENYNLILHGAPGTGKTHLAKEIAEAMNAEVAFCQFHPSYDYTDFVEGLRPVSSDDSGQIGFKRTDGVFKEFCRKALKNLEDSRKTENELSKENSIEEQFNQFINNSIDDKTEYEIAKGNKFFITGIANDKINLSIPANEKTDELDLSRNEILALLNSDTAIENGNDIQKFFERKWRKQEDSYTLSVYKEIRKLLKKVTVKQFAKIEKKNFVFIIDEINRGELSKIFGELFFSIDPGYRGLDENGTPKGLVTTQYQNLVEDTDPFKKGFFVPENVYIIGTMNDIDRSVESMDFAMRRRFIFKEVTAEESAENMNLPDEAKETMKRINDLISKTEGLGSAYHIGGAYFLNVTDFDKLWNLKLSSLVKEYLRGLDDDESKFKRIEDAYFNRNQEGSE